MLDWQFGTTHFLPDLCVNCGFPVNACSIRCSSMRCKHRFKKSISNACWPIFRSNSGYPVLVGSLPAESAKGVLRRLLEILSPAMQ